MITNFQILGQTIEVIIDNEYCHKNKCYGQFIPFENKIIIANKFKSKKVWIDYKQEIIDATYTTRLYIHYCFMLILKVGLMKN